ncbi:MAG TPA: response regulator [Terriglobia bacterium]|nr:response regulator [Terriglobia bacterium]
MSDRPAGPDRAGESESAEPKIERRTSGRRLDDQLVPFFNLTLDMLCIAGFDGYFKRLNPAWELTLGFTRQELLSQPYLDLVHPADREATIAAAQALTQGNLVTSFENRYRVRDGSYKWLLWNAASVPDRRIIYASARDITDRKRADARLAVEYATACILAEPGGASETVLGLLRAVCEALGWELGTAWSMDDEALELHCVEVWHAPRAGLEEFEAASRQSRFARGVGLPGRVWASGEPTWVRDVTGDPSFPRADLARRLGLCGAFGFPILLGGETIGVIEFFSEEIQKPDADLLKTLATLGSQIGQFIERQRAEEALRESMERVRLLLHSTAEAIYGVDLEGNCTFANPACVKMLGYHDAGQFLDQNLHDLVHYKRADGTPYPAEECPIGKAVRLGQAIHGDDEVLWRADGTSFPVEYWSHPMFRHGKLIGAVTTFLDITKRREIERMKNEFISVVSHELRTPLTSIRGALGLVASGRLGALPEKSQRMLDIAVTNTDRLVRLINEILDIERIESGRVVMARRTCDAAALVTQALDVMRPLAEKAGVSFSASACPCQLWADPDRILQTLTNLLSNAIKFSPPGGTVRVEAEFRGTDAVLFRVRDQGRGIPADKLDRIFERFEQVDASDAREKGGTGLGLAICRSIVQQHGGRIWVESVLGRGSDFCFTLPVAEPATPQTEPAPPAPALAGRTVLVCDDDPSIRSVIAELLTQRGYRVLATGSGREALEQAMAAPPAAILLDLIMPGMSGWEVMAALKAKPETRDIPIIICSVLSPSEGAATPEGVAGWVRKPLEEGLLFQALDRAFQGQLRLPQVLLVEDDRDLSRVIIATFERHGIKIFHAGTGREAIDLVQRLPVDLIVLDVNLPEVDGFAVVDWLRQQKRLREIPLVVYTVHDLADSDRARLDLGHTEFLTKGRVSPEDFEQRVVGLLGRMMNYE